MILRQKNIIIAFVFLIIALAIIFLLAHPAFKEIKKNSDEFVRIKKELVSLENDRRNLIKRQQFYGNLAPDLLKTENLFISASFPVQFVRFLEKTASEADVLMTIGNVEPAKSGADPWRYAGFQLSLRCYLPDCLKFLEKIENSPYLINVQNLNIRRISVPLPAQDGKEKQDNAEASILIKVYSK